jgi:hypothetical protein
LTIGVKKVVVWIWKLINMKSLWKRIFACYGFTRGARNARVEENNVFFLGILMDERFIFVSLSFRMTEIHFDVGFIIRPTKFSLIDTPSFIILYSNLKNCDF